MSGNDFLGAFYEKTQKPTGFSWLEGVQTGQEFENPLAPATTPSPDENSFHSFYCTKGASTTFNHAGKRAFRNPVFIGLPKLGPDPPAKPADSGTFFWPGMPSLGLSLHIFMHFLGMPKIT